MPGERDDEFGMRRKTFNHPDTPPLLTVSRRDVVTPLARRVQR